MTYTEKLRSPKWQKKRLEIFERDEWKCVKCGDGEHTLNAHHIRYLKGKEPWDYPDSNFITVCDKCHRNIHNKQIDTDKSKVIQKDKELDDSFLDEEFTKMSMRESEIFMDFYYEYSNIFDELERLNPEDIENLSSYIFEYKSLTDYEDRNLYDFLIDLYRNTLSNSIILEQYLLLINEYLTQNNRLRYHFYDIVDDAIQVSVEHIRNIRNLKNK